MVFYLFFMNKVYAVMYEFNRIGGESKNIGTRFELGVTDFFERRN